MILGYSVMRSTGPPGLAEAHQPAGPPESASRNDAEQRIIPPSRPHWAGLRKVTDFPG